MAAAQAADVAASAPDAPGAPGTAPGAAAGTSGAGAGGRGGGPGASGGRKNRIQVSNTKKPLYFYINLSKVELAQLASPSSPQFIQQLVGAYRQSFPSNSAELPLSFLFGCSRGAWLG